MKRRDQWIALAVAVMLLLALLYGCQASAALRDGNAEAPTTEVAVNTSGAPETTGAAVTEPVLATEGTQETEAAAGAAMAAKPTGTKLAPTEQKATRPGAQAPTPNAAKPTEATEPSQPEAATPKATEPKATEPKSAEPKSTEPTPTEPKPTKPEQTEPKPTEPKPTEPTPTNPTHSHKWSEWMMTKAPTCVAEGVGTRVCSVCGQSETLPIVPNPYAHNWSAWTQTKAPTCAATGEASRSCSWCGVKECETIPATGTHSWIEDGAPTCTAGGTRTCTTCGTAESTAALGHDWVYHDEERHCVWKYTCYCGAAFFDYDEYDAHFEYYLNLLLEGQLTEEENCHGGYECHQEWIVDKPAYNTCPRCNEINYECRCGAVFPSIADWYAHAIGCLFYGGLINLP